MNRREFLSVLGGASALSAATMINPSAAFAEADLTSQTTSLYVKGLVMLDLGNPESLRLGFPKAPGHKATLSIVPQNGSRRSLTIKGNGTVDAPQVTSADPRIFVPELVRMKEFYGNDVKSRVDKCPGVISISRNAIRSVAATELTPVRYTFVRTDTGEEVTSFRPRQVADAITPSRPTMKVLYMSAFVGHANDVLDKNASFIAKPFTPQALLEAVESVLAM